MTQKDFEEELAELIFEARLAGLSPDAIGAELIGALDQMRGHLVSTEDNK